MASSGPQDIEMRSPPRDSAFSLRELALKSMKSRRKPHSEYLLPPRPSPAEATFQLDYGQEEVSPPRDTPQTPSVPTPESPASKLPTPKSPASKLPVVAKPAPQAVPAPPTVSESRPAPVLDNQAREEGEISDEEEVEPATEPPKPPSPLSQPASAVPVPRGPRQSTPSASTQATSDPSQSKLPLSERLSDPPAMPDYPAFARSEASSAMQIDPAPALPAPGNLVDPDHIRPGVSLNQDQYDKAKDIVLDLLGWGVDPEYLVDCGVTREVVYYVFTELNLRLPQNLDTNGLTPFTPEDALELQKTVLMPPPPPPPPVRARRPSQDFAPASTKASIPTPSPPPAALPAGASNTPLRVIESSRPVSTSDLHDMEQQRRQELMARKAAIASRKSKNMPPSVMSSPPTSLPSNSEQGHDMNVDSVEDFLKTIGSSSNITGSRAATSIDDMDVDEIPGLSGARSYKTTTSNTPQIPSSSSSSVPPTELSHALLPPPLSTESASTTCSTETSASSLTETQLSEGPLQHPPSSAESSSTTYSSRSTETSASSLSETRLIEGPSLQRRVFKRPVASDFVDFEESRPPSHSRNGIRPANGGLKRRPTGFASVVSQPRCIIDVSDSEGEGDGDVVMRDMQTAWRSGYASPVPTKPFVAHLNTNGWATPPVSTTPTPIITSVASTPTGTMSPAALLEKENEIQRMREMIAQKERKLKEAKALEANSKADVIVKREETPVTLAPDGGSSEQSRLVAATAELERCTEADRSETLSKSSSHSTPVATTPSIGSLFRLPTLPTSD